MERVAEQVLGNAGPLGRVAGEPIARIENRFWDLVRFQAGDPAQDCVVAVKEGRAEAATCRETLDNLVILSEVDDCVGTVAFGPTEATQAEFHLSSGDVVVSAPYRGVAFGAWCADDSGGLEHVEYFGAGGRHLGAALP